MQWKFGEARPARDPRDMAVLEQAHAQVQAITNDLREGLGLPRGAS